MTGPTTGAPRVKKLRTLVIAEIANAHAERIDDEWARICEATDG